MHEKIKAGIVVVSWLLFWINWMSLILMLIIEKDKEDNGIK